MFVSERGWTDQHTPGSLALALASEVGELCHLLRWHLDTTVSVPTERLADELADIAIFLLHFAELLNLDLAELIWQKIDTNEERFPLNSS